MFDDWDKTGSIFRKGKLRAAELDAARLSGEGATLASDVIHAAGEAFGSDFYATWNGEADVRLFADGGVGVLAVMEMARPDDEYGPTDTPTFAWRTEGGRTWLVASKTWRDSGVADALGIDWPDRAQFAALSGVQGWGE